jgi:hypothetical protein
MFYDTGESQVNDPQINDAQLTQEHEPESIAPSQKPAELVELENADLREVSGGGGGSVSGYS